MRAAGLWQFMPYTGKQMGLRQDAWYDDRYDVLASTRGALKYLRQLHQSFDGDWALALAAYNAGPARVRAAREANARAGKPTDYWSLNLPRETEAYVPKLLAVIALVETPERFGQHLPALPVQAPLAVIQTRQPLQLAAAATAGGLPLERLKQLNPSLKKGHTRSGDSVNLLVPQQAVGPIRQHLRTIRDQKAALAATAAASPAEET
jgi:membrane-bound lytic murein transglycosylase D